MSCLPQDALSHFEQRERALLARNQQLDEKKAQVLSEASTAARDAASPPLRRPPVDDAAPLEAPSLSASQVLEQERAELPASGTPLRRATPDAVASQGRGATDTPESLHTTIRLQSAKISAIEEELDRTIAELASRDSENRQLKQRAKELSDENARLQKAAGPNDALERLKKQLAAAEAKVKDLEGERAELARSRDQLDLQVKKHAAESSTKEARLNRLSEECEKQKQALREAGNQDKDRVAADRKEMDRLSGEVRKLERQRTELVTAFKKQMKLIDVLKRQRAHMEAARVLSFTEDEFIRILELGDKLGE